MAGTMDLFVTAFNLAYLTTIWVLAALMGWRYLRQPPAQRRVSRWPLCAVFALGVGDMFHLVAQAHRTLTGIESIACTWNGREVSWVETAIVGLLAMRLVLLFFPQNNWGGSAPAWRIYRNIPFALAGFSLAYLFLQAASTTPNPAGKWLAGTGWAVIISFACYIGTILLVDRYPMTGILMLPKTIAYVVVAVYFYKLKFQPHESNS